MDRSVDAVRDALLRVLLLKARKGSVEALGCLFEACRGYLMSVARQELGASLRTKVEAADVVQETFIEATRDFASFRGQTSPQLLGWLRGILRHNITDLTRRYGCLCRCLSQEVPLLDRPRIAATRANDYLAVGGPICEQLIAQEQRRALEDALQRLPSSYRNVLQLRFGERCSFEEIGKGIQRSPEAARKLFCRAVQRLRQEMRGFAEV